MKVYLIGAGPGDPGLLTLRGQAALAAADVVVYDYLAAEALLQMARPDAERVYVGKISGNHALPQHEINALLVRLGKEGKIVARLKGGDPYIFGRGGEEAEALVEAGVPFEEVPGITSVIAGPAYAGIPLTHRAFASSVTIITGHEDPTKPESVHNWDALAKGASTLVFVMGMKNLPNISASLIKAGLPSETPAALVMWGTTPKHRSHVGTLGSLPKDAKNHGFSNPCLIIVGDVVQLRDRLNWFEQKPLLGKSVVVTRAREQASDIAALLEAQGAEVIQFPTIRIAPLDDFDAVDSTAKNLSAYDWVIFTSVNGVRAFWERLRTCRLDSRAFGSCKLAAIGPATADALRGHGLEPDFVPAAYVAESIAEGLVGLGMSGKKILLARAAEAREVLPQRLREAGATVDILPVYRTVPALERRDDVLERLAAGSLHCITFGSSSTVDNFFAAIPADMCKAHPNVAMACIGPVTGDTLRKHGFEPTVQPDAFTIPGLIEAICAYYANK